MNACNIKKSLKGKNPVIGTWITLPDLAVTELMTQQGFDWLSIDMEHSAISVSQAQNLIRIIDLAGLAPLVRVGANHPLLIKQVMDAGAHGVIVPMVNTAQDAAAAVRAVKYPPIGERGVGLARAQGYGLSFDHYRKWVNAQSVVIVQIEHIAAINNLEEILKVLGIDASIIGPYDLSASLGYPGEFERPEVVAAIKHYRTVCDQLKKPSGFHVIPPEAQQVRQKIKQGYRFIGFSLDTLFLGEKCRSEMNRLGRGAR